MNELLFFNKMIVPKLITLIYWIALLGAVVTGFRTMFGGLSGYGGFSFGNFLMGCAVMVGGAIAARVWCELTIVMFKMNEALQEIRRK